MTTAYSELVIAKFISAALLTLASWLGLIAPFFLFRLIGVQQHRHVHSHTSSEVRRSPILLLDNECESGIGSSSQHDKDEFPPGIPPSISTGGELHHHAGSSSAMSDEWNVIAISCANCVSAGILLWTGLMHFFVESAESFISNEKGHSIPDGLQQALLWCTIGIFIPLVVERVLWPWMVDRLVPPGSSRSGNASTASTPKDESLAAMLVSHGHHHGSHVRVSTANEGGGATSCSVPHHGSQVQQQQQQQQQQQVVSGRSPRRTRELAAAVLIAVLMSVHSATEGVAVGVEQSVLSLKQSVTPLIVHKIFDGWLVGIGAFRASDSGGKGSTAPRAIKALFTVSPQRYSLIIWLAALPAFLLAIAPFVHPNAAPLTSLGQASPPTAPHHALGDDGGAPHMHSHPPASLTVAVAQATSSGSFLYVALCAILVDELSATESVADVTKRVKKNVLLVGAGVFGLVLGSLLASGHD